MFTVYDGKACKPLFRFWMDPGPLDYEKTVRYSVVIDSTDGLLLAKDGAADTLFVCNPMTEKYVVLPCLDTYGVRYISGDKWIFGFGVSKISGQYKVLSGGVFSGTYLVYTLGGGFCNGNLHWLVSHFNFEDRYMVCCFDLETELFTSFSLPPHVSDGNIHDKYRLCILEGRLCLCDCSGGYNVVIWLMNKYGDENSWIKEYTFDLPQDTGLPVISPLKVLDNGDLLFTMNLRCRLYIYSKKTKDVITLSHLDLSTSVYYHIATYTPSFLSLKAMGIHNIQSLDLYS